MTIYNNLFYEVLYASLINGAVILFAAIIVVFIMLWLTGQP